MSLRSVKVIDVGVFFFLLVIFGAFTHTGAPEKDPQETQRLRAGAGVPADDEGCVLQHQRGQEADGEAGDFGGMAVPHRRLGGGLRLKTPPLDSFK